MYKLNIIRNVYKIVCAIKYISHLKRYILMRTVMYKCMRNKKRYIVIQLYKYF